MQNVDNLRSALPEAAKDLSLNLSSLLKTPPLGTERTWGVALTSAFFLRSAPLRDALLADAAEIVPPEVVDDARAAAAADGHEHDLLSVPLPRRQRQLFTASGRNCGCVA
ncbi:MAG: hypothetical protein R3C10_21750 [Pirellulales bacterium]